MDAKKSNIDSLDNLRQELVNKCLLHNARWTYNIAKIVLDKDIRYRLLSKLWYTQSYLKAWMKSDYNLSIHLAQSRKKESHFNLPTSWHPFS